MKIPILSLLLLVLTVAVPALQALAQHADKVFLNAYVWTVDDEIPKAEALAVHDGKILAVTSSEGIKPFIGPDTRVIDAQGRLILPGFIDNHTHFTSGGFQLQSIDLRHAQTEREFARLIAEWAERHRRQCQQPHP